MRKMEEKTVRELLDEFDNSILNNNNKLKQREIVKELVRRSGVWLYEEIVQLANYHSVNENGEYDEIVKHLEESISATIIYEESIAYDEDGFSFDDDVEVVTGMNRDDLKIAFFPGSNPGSIENR